MLRYLRSGGPDVRVAQSAPVLLRHCAETRECEHILISLLHQ